MNHEHRTLKQKKKSCHPLSDMTFVINKKLKDPLKIYLNDE